MNDQQILSLIAANPNMRAVQIADALDEAKCDVEASLRCMVEEGDIVTSIGKSALGCDVLEYNLADKFLGDRENAALLEKARTPDTPKFSDQTLLPDFGRTKPELALAYLRKFQRASSAELRAAMGLDGKQYPQAYLTASLKNGEIVKTVRGWELGNCKRAAIVPVERNLPQAEAAIPASPAPGSITLIQTNRALRCAIWSHGTVELHADSQLIAVLTRDQADFIADFILGQRQAAT